MNKQKREKNLLLDVIVRKNNMLTEHKTSTGL